MVARLGIGFLAVGLAAGDELHLACTAALLNESQSLLPNVVIPELAFMVLPEPGYPVLPHFLQSIIQRELIIKRAIHNDSNRTVKILEKYADSRIGRSDCVIAAMAQRIVYKAYRVVASSRPRLLVGLGCLRR